MWERASVLDICCNVRRMGKKLTKREAVFVLIIFFIFVAIGIVRFGATRDRYKVYIANVVADRIYESLNKCEIKDTLLTDYAVFKKIFPLSLPNADFEEFIYRKDKDGYYIRIIASDRKKTVVEKRN